MLDNKMSWISNTTLRVHREKTRQPVLEQKHQAKHRTYLIMLCGREGGMLRAVLCSWRFGNDCLYKETVVRMQSDVYESAKAKSWLKVCLGTR